MDTTVSYLRNDEPMIVPAYFGRGSVGELAKVLSFF